MESRNRFVYLRRIPVIVTVGLIKVYIKYISPMKPSVCRFYPSCSHYAIESLEKCGIIKGAFKTIIRLIKCHPFHPGGYDPVDKQSS